jgi:sugar lactone lactonase YvrE
MKKRSSLRIAALAAVVTTALLVTPSISDAAQVFTGSVSASGTSFRSHTFSVSQPSTITATLDWDGTGADLTLSLYDQTGTWVKGTGTSTAKPEVVVYDAQTTGTWKLGVKAKTGSANYTLTVDLSTNPASPTYSRDLGRFATAEISPVDMARDGSGNWYVFDEGLACLRKYGPDLVTVLRTYFTCGEIGKDDTHLSRGRGLGRDPSSGALWIADTGAHRLLKLDVGTGNVLVTTTLSGSAGGALFNPMDVAIDNNGNAYVIDEKNRVVKVSSTGQYLAQWGTTGSGSGQLRLPKSIEFSTVGQNALYVTDSRNFRVAKFGLTGQWLGSFGSKGTGNGQMTKDARGIAVDQAGIVYVADVGGNRILRFQPNGDPYVPLVPIGNGLPYYRSGPRDLFYGARGLLVAGGQLAVADMWNYRMLLWELDGTSTGEQIGTTRPPWDGHLEPRGVALDDDGNVYVSDYWHQWIQKFGPNGDLLAHWGIGRGSAPGTLNLPGGIEVDDTRGYLYIANREERVIDRWLLSDGSFSQRFPMPSGPVDPLGWPHDVGVDESTGRVYGADERNNQVPVFAPTGSLLYVIREWGSGQALGSIRSVDVAPSGDVYVADATNERIHVYSASGTWLRSFSTLEAPNGVEATDTTIYVLTWRVREYTPAGSLIRTWSSTGTADGQLRMPYVGIAVDASGDVYIGDSRNHRVKVFSP